MKITQDLIERKTMLMVALVVAVVSVGGRYGDEWHRIHLDNPRDVVPESNMPGYSWLAKTPADASLIVAKLKTLRGMGHPYTDEDIAGAKKALEGKTEQDALIAYLQGLGTALKDAN